MRFYFLHFLQGKNAQNRPENQQNWNLAKIGLKSDNFMKWKPLRQYLGNVWTIKVVLEFWFDSSKCHFFGLKNGHFWQKWLFSDHKKWHFWWQNQNSKTTFIVQTFPKYCRKGFYFIKISLFSPILAKFQFCWFSGLFWAFFPCKKGKK